MKKKKKNDRKPPICSIWNVALLSVRLRSSWREASDGLKFAPLHEMFVLVFYKHCLSHNTVITVMKLPCLHTGAAWLLIQRVIRRPHGNGPSVLTPAHTEDPDFHLVLIYPAVMPPHSSSSFLFLTHVLSRRSTGAVTPGAPFCLALPGVQMPLTDSHNSV